MLPTLARLFPSVVLNVCDPSDHIFSSVSLYISKSFPKLIKFLLYLHLKSSPPLHFLFTVAKLVDLQDIYHIIHNVLNCKTFPQYENHQSTVKSFHHSKMSPLFGKTFLVLSCLATDNVEALSFV